MDGPLLVKGTTVVVFYVCLWSKTFTHGASQGDMFRRIAIALSDNSAFRYLSMESTLVPS